MREYIDLCIGAGLWPIMFLGIASYFFLTRIFKIEHDEFHDQWVKDGQPHGLPFWFPTKDTDSFIETLWSSYPWNKGILWYFKKPEWVKNHERASRMFRYFRLTSYLAYLIIFMLFIFIALSTPR